MTTKPVIVFLAFANDREDKVGEGYLRNLPDEARRLREVLQPAEQAGLCEVVVRGNSTAGDIFGVFQDPQYRNRIAIFHYGGHANGYQLALEAASGAVAAADAAGLARFFAQQQGLQLVFLNGCSTAQQTDDLLDANIPAVISTSRPIDDRIATNFAHQFYQGLAGGASLRTAYNEAEASVQTTEGGGSHRGGFGDRKSQAAKRELAERIPWKLHLSEGADSADEWNLPQAVGNPLFGLPPLPQQDLPESPYRHLNWFTRKDAEVFFGRGHQIRELYDRLTAPDTPPIMLFYGQSGVGKSSILDAGLIPRLERDYEVRYLRRTADGLLATLQRSFSVDAGAPAQVQKSLQPGKPVVEFLDRVKQLYRQSNAPAPQGQEYLLQVLNAMFSEPDRYLHQQAEGLLETLQPGLEPEAKHEPISTAWRQQETQLGKPLIVFLDQVEELYTHPSADVPDELEQFLHGLKAVFTDRDQRPQGKLVLAFRKEWLAELEAQLVEQKLPRSKVFLEALDRRGIIEVVRGPTQTERLRQRYGLTVEDGLAQIIADDLLEDSESAIAPTLQILLTKMWTTASQANDQPQFTQVLYQGLKRDGILLRDFLDQQIARFRERNPGVVDSGLLLDMLAMHTTALGTAGHCSLESLQQQYSHLAAELGDLLQRCQDLHLLTIAAGSQKHSGKTTRLAHDTLAPLVRERFDESDLPGQRARRILDNRSVDWDDGQTATPLDEADLAIVEKGMRATRSLNVTEQRLLAASRERRAIAERNRKRRKTAWLGGVAAIAVLGMFGWWQSIQANKQKVEAESQKTSALLEAGNAAWQRAVSARDYERDGVLAAHLFVKAADAFALVDPQRAANVLAAMDDGLVASFPHADIVVGAALNYDETQVLSWSNEPTIRLWDVKGNKLLNTFQHDGVEAALFTGDGQRLLSWGRGGKVRLWDPAATEPLTSFGSGIMGVLANGDPSQLLTWSKDGMLRLWDVEQGQELRAYKHDGVQGALVNGKQTRLLSWGKDGKVKLWDPELADPLDVLDHESRVAGAAFNDDGSRLVTWSHHSLNSETIKLWDTELAEELQKYEHPGLTGASITGDGSRLLSWGLDGKVRLWDPAHAGHPEIFDRGVARPMGAVLGSNDSRLLAWFDDGGITLWGVKEPQQPMMLQHQREVIGALFYANTSRVLSWSVDGTVRLWSVEEKLSYTGETTLGQLTVEQAENEKRLIKVFKHRGFTSALLNAAENRLLSWGVEDGMVRLWNLEQGEPLSLFKHKRVADTASVNGEDSQQWLLDSEKRRFPDSDQLARVGVTGALFDGDRPRLFTRGLLEGVVRLWDTAPARPRNTRDFIHDLADGVLLNSDGSRLLTWSSDGTARLWDPEKSEFLSEYKYDLSTAHKLIGASFYEGGIRLLSKSEDGALQIWNPPQPKASITYQHDGVKDAVLSSDGSHLLSWAPRGTIRLWDATTDKPPQAIEHKQVVGAAFNRDGSLLLTWGQNHGGTDGKIKLWNPADASLMNSFEHEGVNGATFNADSKRLLSWGNDRKLRLWDPWKPELLHTFAHKEGVTGASFNGDGSMLLTWDNNGLVRLWDPTLEQPLRTYQHDYAVRQLLSGDGAWLLSLGGVVQSKLWTVPVFDDVSKGTMEAIRLKLEVRSAATLTEQGAYRLLTYEEWQARRETLSAPAH